jgi:hypothetical protein
MSCPAGSCRLRLALRKDAEVYLGHSAACGQSGEKPVRIVGLIGGTSRNKRKIDNKRQVV